MPKQKKDRSRRPKVPRHVTAVAQPTGLEHAQDLNASLDSVYQEAAERNKRLDPNAHAEDPQPFHNIERWTSQPKHRRTVYTFLMHVNYWIAGRIGFAGDAVQVYGPGRRRSKRGKPGELRRAQSHIDRLTAAIESARSFHYDPHTLVYHPDLTAAMKPLSIALQILRRKSEVPFPDFLPTRTAGGKRRLRVRFPDDDEPTNTTQRDIVARLARLLKPMNPAAPRGEARKLADALILPLLPPHPRRGQSIRTAF